MTYVVKTIIILLRDDINLVTFERIQLIGRIFIPYIFLTIIEVGLAKRKQIICIFSMINLLCSDFL